ncbi:DsbA family protein [Oceanobacillus piezotolerans]|uniref:ClpXP adapter protein SpxH n=1 Tax=Oceanobacillus piezotolerans TaxID=2448030 RepID=A0A498D5X7_9BACI|nr:ClpXP adapter SpxH family protein [Oceanobacillus piezotolerans]RLL45069.1 DsbA family protein [Oceanobacillus piezotolerans]
MSWNQFGLKNADKANSSEPYTSKELSPKPVEMYVFIDPLCPECWSLEPFLKKLSVEYGRFFTVRIIVSNFLNAMDANDPNKHIKLREHWERVARRTGMSCDGDFWLENSIANPWNVSIAIKAAEIQGKKAGKAFLRKTQEKLFLHKLDISDEEVLMQISEEAKIDTEEFAEDLYSETAKKAFQCDVKLTREMDIKSTPTLVFFNQSNDEQGVKITGLYPYEVYELILQEILQMSPIPSEKPPLETFIKDNGIVGSKEISVVYDWTPSKTEKEMKKLLFKQKVSRIHAKYGTFWKYKH